MEVYDIAGKKIELDIDKTYMDFYRVEGIGTRVEINFKDMLETIQSGDTPVDEDLRTFMYELKRWTVEAPRKRRLRQMRLGGMNIMTTDQLFDKYEEGDKIIDNLENTGVFATYFLEKVYGV